MLMSEWWCVAVGGRTVVVRSSEQHCSDADERVLQENYETPQLLTQLSVEEMNTWGFAPSHIRAICQHMDCNQTTRSATLAGQPLQSLSCTRTPDKWFSLVTDTYLAYPMQCQQFDSSAVQRGQQCGYHDNRRSNLHSSSQRQMPSSCDSKSRCGHGRDKTRVPERPRRTRCHQDSRVWDQG